MSAKEATWRLGSEEVAATSRRRGSGARVPKITSASRHGNECRWHQKNERGKGDLGRTVSTTGLDGVAGGESKSGDEMWVKVALRLWWVSGDVEMCTGLNAPL